MGSKRDSSQNYLKRHNEMGLVAALIVYATANAFIWSIVRPPIFGGPDEENHFRLIQEMVSTGMAAFQRLCGERLRWLTDQGSGRVRTYAQPVGDPGGATARGAWIG